MVTSRSDRVRAIERRGVIKESEKDIQGDAVGLLVSPVAVMIGYLPIRYGSARVLCRKSHTEDSPLLEMLAPLKCGEQRKQRTAQKKEQPQQGPRKNTKQKKTLVVPQCPLDESPAATGTAAPP